MQPRESNARKGDGAEPGATRRTQETSRASAAGAVPFADDFRPRLLRLAARSGRALAGDAGGRASSRPGRVEFKDLRPYAAGDDVRFLDWNAYLRSGALVTRTYAADDAPSADILVDRSASGGPPRSRQDRLLRELAAAAGFPALLRGGTARLHELRDGARRLVVSASGRSDGEAWLRAVESLDAPSGSVDWRVATEIDIPRRPGATSALISDLLTDPAPLPLLASLRRAGRAAVLLVVAHDSPFESGDAGRAVSLADPESGARLPAADSEPWRAAHAAVRAEHVAAVAAAASARGLPLVPVSGADSFEDVLRAAGFVR